MKILLSVLVVAFACCFTTATSLTSPSVKRRLGLHTNETSSSLFANAEEAREAGGVKKSSLDVKSKKVMSASSNNKRVTVMFQKPYANPPRIYAWTIGEVWYSDSFSTKVVSVTTRGFSVIVTRTVCDCGWGQNPTMYYTETPASDNKASSYPNYHITITPKSGTWAEARLMCAEMGGDLVHKTLYPALVGGRNYRDEINAAIAKYGGWIGASKSSQIENLLVTVDGAAFSSQNPSNRIFEWREDNPSNNNDENCVHLQDKRYTGSRDRLKNLPCTRNSFNSVDIHGVCEILENS